MVVHAVWVIDASGLPLFHKAYSPLGFDPTLFSSFFSAIVHFQTELMGRQLQDLTFEDLSFSYIVDGGLVFLMCVKKDATTGPLLRSFRDTFYKYFRDNMILLSIPLRDSPEARDLLRRFEREVDSLVGYAPHKKPIPVRVVSIPRLVRKDSPIRQELEKKFGMDGVVVLLLTDGKHTAEDIAEALDIPLTRVRDILMHSEHNGYVKVVRAYEMEGRAKTVNF